MREDLRAERLRFGSSEDSEMEISSRFKAVRASPAEKVAKYDRNSAVSRGGGDSGHSILRALCKMEVIASSESFANVNVLHLDKSAVCTLLESPSQPCDPIWLSASCMYTGKISHTFNP